MKIDKTINKEQNINNREFIEKFSDNFKLLILYP